MSRIRTLLTIPLFFFSACPAFAVLFPPVPKCDLPYTYGLRLEDPWPYAEHRERHLQVQQAIYDRVEEFKRCHQRWGPMRSTLMIYVSGDGDFAVRNTHGESDKCYAWVLRHSNIGPYMCEFAFPYVWDGTLPNLGY